MKKLALMQHLLHLKASFQLIKDKAVTTLGEEAASVFDAHMMVLADPDMTAQIKAVINDKKVNAESALKEVTDKLSVSLKE